MGDCKTSDCDEEKVCSVLAGSVASIPDHPELRHLLRHLLQGALLLSLSQAQLSRSTQTCPALAWQPRSSSSISSISSSLLRHQQGSRSSSGRRVSTCSCPAWRTRLGERDFSPSWPAVRRGRRLSWSNRARTRHFTGQTLRDRNTNVGGNLWGDLTLKKVYLPISWIIFLQFVLSRPQRQ